MNHAVFQKRKKPLVYSRNVLLLINKQKPMNYVFLGEDVNIAQHFSSQIKNNKILFEVKW